MQTGVVTQLIKGGQRTYVKTNGGFMRNLNMLAVIGMALAFALPVYAKTPFSAKDFAAYTGEGKASVEGEAFVKTENGEVRNCSGESVFLAPYTPFDLAVINAFFFHIDVALKKAGPAAPYWRESTCDEEGKFTFEYIPEGTWIAITIVRWGNSGRVIGGQSEGGQLGKKIDLRSGKNRIIMDMKNLRNPMFGFDLK